MEPKTSSEFPLLSYPVVFTIVATYRVCNALVINTQFDPDEYWQTLEPAFCQVFSPQVQADFRRNCALTWEWTRAQTSNDVPISNIRWIDEALYGPVRSYLPIVPTILFYKLLRLFRYDTTWLVAKGPLLLNALIVAAPVDFSVYYISKYISTSQNTSRKTSVFHRIETWTLLASLTNWFHGYALVRTYSNSLETTALVVGIAMLCPELFDRIQDRTEYQIRPLALFAFILGGMSVATRFTALAAWIPLGFVISSRRKKIGSMIFYILVLCALGGVIGVALGCLVDRYFYGFWAIPFLGSFHFNVLLGNGSLYGTHPLLWYIFAGFPAIAGILTPLFLYETMSMTSRTGHHQKGIMNDSKSILLLVISFYIACHSISAHKEFRFILPILPLVCILAGTAMHSIHTEKSRPPLLLMRRKSFLISALILLNYPHLFFLCSVHQLAPIEANKYITGHISRIISNQTNHDGQLSSAFINNPISIHYLMGCHSTPLYSHLHLKFTNSKDSQALPLHTWHLDCSPECRSNPSIPCESDRFKSDPLEFINSEYHLPSEEHGEYCSNLTESETCNDKKSLPDFLAIFEEDLYNQNGLEAVLISNGMAQLKKIRHTVRGIRFVYPSRLEGVHDTNQNENTSVFIGFAHTGFEIDFEHMIIFSRQGFRKNSDGLPTVKITE